MMEYSLGANVDGIQYVLLLDDMLCSIVSMKLLYCN